MTFKLNLLTAAAAIAIASPAFAQTTAPTTTTPPSTTTTQSTTTTEPTTTPPAAPTTTQTTTTQPTTTPQGQPATTTQSTTTQTQPTTTPEGQPATETTQTTTTTTEVTAATASDLKKGDSVYDQSGAVVGKIDSADSEGAVVNTGKARAKVPLASIGKNEKGLVTTITKADIDAQAKDAKKKPKS